MVGRGVAIMIGLLAKIFIKDKNCSSQNTRRIYGIICGGLGIFLNLILFAAKFLAGSISGSIAITADAFNNLSDSGSSLISIIGFKLSGKKPDKDHPFGHGRFEYISGLIVSMLILLMGFELAKGSIQNIIEPQPLEFSMVAVIILILSIMIKLYMALYNYRIGKKIESPPVTSNGIDSLSDSVSTFAVLIALLIFKFFEINLDAYFGLIVSIFILIAGFKAAKDTINPLLGQPPTKEFVDCIAKTVLSHKDICGIHDLVVHNYGPGRVMISLHAEIPSDMDILAAHDLIDNIEIELSDGLNCEAVIHMDPIAVGDPLIDDLKNKLCEIIGKIDNDLSMHDFRLVKGDTHTNLIFDVVVPQETNIDEKQIVECIKDEVTKLNNTYFCVIKIDREYV